MKSRKFFSQELIGIHVHRDDDVLGEGELFQDAAEVAREAEDGADAEHEVEGAELEAPGRRVILLRQRVAERPEAGGKRLLEVPGYRFQALVTSLPRSWSPVAIWRRYNGRAEIENRIKELASQFGLKSFCCRKFWATEAACQARPRRSNCKPCASGSSAVPPSSATPKAAPP